MNAIQKLRQLHADAAAGGAKAVAAWGTASRLLPRVCSDAGEVQRIVREQDVDAFDAIVSALENPQQEAPAQDAEATHDEMKDAMHAFRKRLKLARLNDESKLGGRYTTGGRSSKIDAIEAPREFPRRVWQALVQDGRLRDRGKGFYSDAAEPEKP